VCGVAAIHNELKRLLTIKDVWVRGRRADKSGGAKYTVSDDQVDLRERQDRDE
jgi:hypothetical protein